MPFTATSSITSDGTRVVRHLPVCGASARRATLPGHPRPSLVAHLYRGYEARSSAPQARQGDRAGRDRGTCRLQPPAHRPLRAGRHLCERTRQSQGDGPGGVFILDHDTFAVKGRWEVERGPQYLAYDFWVALGHDTMITSEWGTPTWWSQVVNGEILLAGGYGHRLHIWDLPKRRHRQVIDLGAEATDGARVTPGP